MIVVFPDVSSIAKHVSGIFFDKIKTNPKAVLGLATGGTMEPVYAQFVQQARANQLGVSQITSFNLDEYVGLSANHPQSYAWYMHHHLFSRLPFNLENCHMPDGLATNIDDHCRQYSANIKAAGGIELQLLGVGTNGHIGFNEPGTPFNSCCHQVKLSEQTRIDNSRFFAENELVPACAITMGLNDIMQSKHIVLIATGKQKAATMKLFVENDVTEQVPFTLLKRHPNTTIILDKEAASMLSSSDYVTFAHNKP